MKRRVSGGQRSSPSRSAGRDLGGKGDSDGPGHAGLGRLPHREAPSAGVAGGRQASDRGVNRIEWKKLAVGVVIWLLIGAALKFYLG